MMRPPKPGLSPNTTSSTILFHISAHERSGNCIKTRADLGNKWIGLQKRQRTKSFVSLVPPQTSTPCGVSGSRGIARVSTFGRGKRATICRCIHTDSRLTGERRVSTQRNGNARNVALPKCQSTHSLTHSPLPTPSPRPQITKSRRGFVVQTPLPRVTIRRRQGNKVVAEMACFQAETMARRAIVQCHRAGWECPGRDGEAPASAALHRLPACVPRHGMVALFVVLY